MVISAHVRRFAWWWNAPDEVFTATIDLLAALHVRALEYEAYGDAACLAEAWIELVRRPWPRGTFVLDRPVPYSAGLGWVDELLARLQALTCDPAGRLAIARARDRLVLVATELPTRIIAPAADGDG